MGDLRSAKQDFAYEKEFIRERHLRSSKANMHVWQEVFDIIGWLNRSGDYKENLHILTDRIEKGFTFSQRQISERDDELKRVQIENDELKRRKHLLENQVVSQQEEITRLKGDLEREKWGECDVGVNVAKMRQAVKDLHATFGGMIDSLRSTNNSLGQLRQERPPMPHDVEKLQAEVDQLFTQVKCKLKRWEKNQREMQVELGQTREVLGKFMEQLMDARKTVSIYDSTATATTPAPPSSSPIHLNIHRSLLSVIQQKEKASSTTIPITPPPPPPQPFVFRPEITNNLEGDNETITLYSAEIAEGRTITVKVPVIQNTLPTIVSPPPQPIPVSPSFICTHCREGFTTLVQLRLHSKVIHKDLPSATSQNEHNSSSLRLKRKFSSDSLEQPTTINQDVCHQVHKKSPPRFN